MAKKRPGRPLVETMMPPQQRFVSALEASIARKGMSPTLRELADESGQGVVSDFKLMQRLERNGYVSRTAGKSRSLTVLSGSGQAPLFGLVAISVLGTVAAGLPMFAPENVLGELLVDAATVRTGKHFALTVTGQSMIDAGIHSGDVLIVRQQPLAEHRDIVVALLNDEATVERLHHHDGAIMLLPENHRFKSIPVTPEDDLRIVGKVVAIRGSKSQGRSLVQIRPT